MMKILPEFFLKLSNLQQRVITGTIGACLMIGGIVWNEWTFYLLFAGICYFAMIEYYKLLEEANIGANKPFGIISGMIMFTLVFCIERQFLPFKLYFLLFPFFFLLFLFELFRETENPFINIAFTFLGNIYIAFPFALLNVSAFATGQYDYKIILGIIVCIWANDIGGYLAGMAVGKHKLFYRISPKKTWEGSIGGALLTVFTALALSINFPVLTVIQWLVLASLVIIFGSYGDLVESLLKRSLAIKDSGQSIPGHGGFLDRFDGLLLSSPFIAAFLKIIFTH